MTTGSQSTLAKVSLTSPRSTPARRVVAVVVERRGRVALLKRSQAVQHDKGRWHCVTGYLEAGTTPQQQALEELFEETGLQLVDLSDFHAGQTLRLVDDHGVPWRVHTLKAVTTRRRLQINWEHQAYRWTTLRRVGRFDGRVEWLGEVIRAVYGESAQPGTPNWSPTRGGGSTPAT